MTAAPTTHARLADRALPSIARCMLGLVFVAAGWIAATDYAGFSRELWSGYRLPRPITSLAFFLPPFELALGTAFVLGVRTRECARWATAALAVFSAVIAFGMVNGDLRDCGCFGRVVDVGPWGALARNAALAVPAVWLGWRAPCAAVRARTASLRGALVVVVAVLGAGMTGVSSHSPIVDRTTTRVGERFPVELIVAPDLDVSRGRWLVFGFSPDCADCRDATYQVQSIADAGDVEVVAITASTEDELAEYRERLAPRFRIVSVDAEAFAAARGRLPATWLLDDGIVVHEREGGSPGATTVEDWSWAR